MKRDEKERVGRRGMERSQHHDQQEDDSISAGSRSDDAALVEWLKESIRDTVGSVVGTGIQPDS